LITFPRFRILWLKIGLSLLIFWFFPLSFYLEIQKGAELPRRKHAVWHKRSKGGVKITDTEEMDNDVSFSKYDSLPTPEVNKVQEALRSSSLELRAVVKDPLPDALRMAETVISNLVSKDKQYEPSVENQGGKDVDAPNPSASTGGEPAQTNDSIRGNQSCSHQSNACRPSLMERNSTAHAYEVPVFMLCLLVCFQIVW
jgi:telomeric repeat-binding factor 2